MKTIKLPEYRTFQLPWHLTENWKLRISIYDGLMYPEELAKCVRCPQWRKLIVK
jgi:hypothetical protein